MTGLFWIPGSTSEALEEWTEGLSLVADETRREHELYYDTFDWSLAEAGLRLWTSEESPGWLNLASDSGSSERSLGSEPHRPEDLPQGSLADRLRPVCGLRHLLPQVEITHQIQRWRVLDEEEKTVVRVELRQATVRDHDAGGARPSPHGPHPLDLAPLLRITALRGYEKRAQQLVASAREHFEPLEGSLLDAALERLGRDWKTERKVPAPTLQARERSDQGLARLLEHLAQAAEDNRTGTLLDLDTEFLHDLRVAVRRTRSALSQLKGVLPNPPLGDFRDELKWLGTVTGPVRDLDVFLLDFDGLASQVAENARTDLAPLRAHLIKRREEELASLQAALSSNRCEAFFSEWKAFLTQLQAAPNHDLTRTERGAEPIAELAAERIAATAKKLRRSGRAIGPTSAPEELHELRIQGKKLRYLLELFRSLLDPEEYARQHATLKRLQTVLGDYNDCAVQQESLLRFAEEMQAESEVPPATLLALGRLTERIELRAERLRTRFDNVFAAFDETELRDAFKAMLARAGRARKSGRSKKGAQA